MFFRMPRESGLFRPKNAKKSLRIGAFVAYIATAVRKDESPKGEFIHTWQQAR
jgi:hypothetical protein